MTTIYWIRHGEAMANEQFAYSIDHFMGHPATTLPKNV